MKRKKKNLQGFCYTQGLVWFLVSVFTLISVAYSIFCVLTKNLLQRAETWLNSRGLG